MAEKKGKRPKHTRLVVPGSGTKKSVVEKDRLGRSVPQGAAAAGPAPVIRAAAPNVNEAAPPPAGREKRPAGRLRHKKKQPAPGEGPVGEQSAGDAAPAAAVEGVDSARGEHGAKTIHLPKRGKARKPKGRVAAVRRRKLLRRVRRVAVLALVLLVVLFFASGSYLTAATYLSDAYDSLHMMARPGDGYPMSFGMTGFVSAQQMGGGGFAVLGDKELAIVSGSGAELWRVKHGYVMPGMSAGNARVVLYSRGGKEYTVESRSKTIASLTTEHDIQFAEMSPGGWLALVTASRFRTDLLIYDPTYNAAEAPAFSWQVKDVKPVLASFAKDNRHLVLGCVTTKDGAMASVLYLLRVDRDSVQAEIWQEGAMLLRADYLDGGRVLAVYDRLAVLYNQKGEELARYEYGERRLLAADVSGGNMALVFGATSQDTLHVVAMDTELRARFDQTLEGGGTVQVLCDGREVFLLSGQRVTALDSEGQMVSSRMFEQNALALLHGSQPLLLLRGQVVALEDMLKGDAPQQATSAQSAGAAADSGGNSPGEGAGTPAQSDAPQSDAPPGGQDGT